jgi:hypothetical protein
LSTQQSSLTPYIFRSDAELPEERLFFEGLLSEGDFAIWLGREKHRKTNVLLQFAICAALGRSFLHFEFKPSQPLKIIIVDYETKTHSLKRRYDAICTAMKLSKDDCQLLSENLEIVEVRKMLRAGHTLSRFSVSGEQGDSFWIDLEEKHKADIYILDPMRCMHAQDENESSIEQLLASLRRFFKKGAVIIAHHLRKRGNSSSAPTLEDDMRVWSDDARGSGAIKAHADVIICQERIIDGQGEIVFWGAFLKDGADIQPIPLEETEAESFFWHTTVTVPQYLQVAYRALQTAGGKFGSKKAAIRELEKAGIKQSTAYRQFQDLKVRGLINEIVGAGFTIVSTP